MELWREDNRCVTASYLCSSKELRALPASEGSGPAIANDLFAFDLSHFSACF